MIFTELRFVIFFLAVFYLYWRLPANRPRKVLLLGASYLFYAAWDWRFLSLILASSLIDYFVALRIAGTTAPGPRRRWLWVSLAGNLGMLGFFKYFGFFVDSGVDFLQLLGLSASRPTLEIILPVGISFYTFQTLSYSIDVYRGRLEPSRQLLDVALFVGFFPQLVAGPIVRAAHFLPQLTRMRYLADVQARRYVGLFLVGFVKKACVSDNIAPFVDQFFAAPSEFTALSAWIATVLYAAQIYCDFSGYSDMAIACAGLLGYDIGINFAAPYTAADIRDFWRRWHISLSTWLRDYLYIPLGGNRGSRAFLYRNLMLTMLLGGLWHGAAWNFVIWGGLHGLALVAQREWSRLRTAVKPNAAGTPRDTLSGRGRGWRAVVSTTATLYWVCLAWIFFRAESLEDALIVSESFVLLRDAGSRQLDPALLVVVAALFAVHWAGRDGRLKARAETLSPWAYWPAYGAGVAVALTLVTSTLEPFIYFQF